MRRFKSIVRFVQKNKLLLFIILCASFVRLFRLGDFAMFLADQGRDAIIIKRIVTFEHFPAIGPPSSIGQVYLGPFFYYLMSPFLFLSRLDPVGLALGEAVISLAGIIFAYMAVKKVLGIKTAFVLLFFASFSFELVRSARFAWNPNPLPYFAFAALYFLYETVTTRKWQFALLFGIFFALCFQLHHLAAFMAMPIFLTFVVAFLRERKAVPFILNIAVSLGGFLLISLPLIIFDLKHDFLNVKNLDSLFTKQNLVAGGSLFTRLLDTNRAFLSFATGIQIPDVIAAFVSLGVVLLTLYTLSKEKKLPMFVLINLLSMISYIYLFSLLSSPRHPHYFGVVYLSFYLLVAYLLIHYFQKKLIVVLYFVIIAFALLNISQYDFIAWHAGYQMRHAKAVAASIIPHIGDRPFNFATYPIEYTSEETYLYYLEISGHKAADRSAHEITDQMFVLCDRGKCDILHTKSWNIDMFGPAKIDTMWEAENIRIFRLIHASNI